MVCLVCSVVAVSHRQFSWAGGVNVCQLCVSGQAGLHGNVFQSCCLLAAFCGANVRQMVVKPPRPPLLLGAAPPVQALLSSLLNTPLCFHTLEGPQASPFRRTGHDKGNCDVPNCSLLAFVLVFLANCHFSQEQR